MTSKITSAVQLGARRMILATAAEGLPNILGTTGFYNFDAHEAFSAFHTAGLWIGPRDALEQMPNYRQIIPYVVLRVGDQFVRYTRTPTGGEDRLHGKMSIGLGGHIDLSDIVSVNDCVDLIATFQNAAQRELDEEIGDIDCISREWIGILVDNDTDVGRVHIGIVGILNLRTAPTDTNDHAISDISLCSVEELKHSRNRLEGWSTMLLDYFSNTKPF
jgi:predicted NUDIX family phosphoesterase